MIWFSERKELERQYYEWIKENGIADQPNSVIAFLEINGLLQNEKVHEKAGIIKPKPQTNFDKLKAMTVEEMAEFLNDFYDDAYGDAFNHEDEHYMTKEERIKWLQQEVQDD